MIPMLMERDPAPIIDVTKPALPKRYTWDAVAGRSDVLLCMDDPLHASDCAADAARWVIPPVEPMSDAAREMLEHTLRAAHAVKEATGLPRKVGPEPAKPWTDDWIEWKGGECPVAANAIIQRKYRDGADGFMKAPAAYFRWTHLGEDRDIIAYRVVG